MNPEETAQVETASSSHTVEANGCGNGADGSKGCVQVKQATREARQEQKETFPIQVID